jgi:ABC-2 type transport system permease protein
LGVLLVWWMIGYPAQIMGTAGGVLDYLDLSLHYYNTFFRGIIDLKDIVFYASVIGAALFIGSVSIETRRWR